MKLLGYVLLLLNLLTGAAVAYLASQSWAKRQEQNANALRYYLLKDGEPQEGAAIAAGASDDSAVPMPVSTGKGHTVETVSVKFLKEHFKGTESGVYADSMPPASRVAELMRLKAKFDGVYSAKGSDSVKLAFLVGSYKGVRFLPGPLVLLADSFDERLAYKALAGELLWPAGLLKVLKPDEIRDNAKRAKEVFDSKFDAAINKANSGKYAEDIANIDTAKKAMQDAEVAAKQVADDQRAAAAAFRTQMDAVLAGTKREVDADGQAKFFAFVGDPKGGTVAEVKGKSQIAVEQVTAAANQLQAVILTTGLTAYDDNDRKRRGTILMQSLDASEAWQKRVALTVGLNDYLAGVQDRIERQPDYPTRYERLRDYLTIKHFESYDRAKDQARDLDRLLVRQIEIRLALEQQAARAKQLLAQRKTQRDSAKTDAEATEATVAGLVASQDAVERELFALQTRVGAMLRTNFDLEDRVVDAEKRLSPRN